MNFSLCWKGGYVQEDLSVKVRNSQSYKPSLNSKESKTQHQSSFYSLLSLQEHSFLEDLRTLLFCSKQVFSLLFRVHCLSLSVVSTSPPFSIFHFLFPQGITHGGSMEKAQFLDLDLTLDWFWVWIMSLQCELLVELRKASSLDPKFFPFLFLLTNSSFEFEWVREASPFLFVCQISCVTMSI